MKKLSLILGLLLSTTLNAQLKEIGDSTKEFDFVLFQKTLTQEMELNFPWLKEDTTINYVAKATSQKEAGYAECHVTKKGGMVDLTEDEVDQAKRLVKEYKEYLFESPYFGEDALN
jgi:hypothetical protein